MKLKFNGLSAAVVLVAAAVFLYFVEPGSTGWAPPCLFHVLTGLYCPGCGTGRGLHLLVHGDFAGALQMNSLMVLTLPLLVYLIVRQSVTNKPVQSWVYRLITVIIFAYWLGRNIPTYPFTILAPH